MLVGTLPAAAQTAPTGSGQTYPTRAVRLIIPFSAGGAADVPGRIQGAPEKFFDFMKVEAAKWAKVVQDSGARV